MNAGRGQQRARYSGGGKKGKGYINLRIGQGTRRGKARCLKAGIEGGCMGGEHRKVAGWLADARSGRTLLHYWQIK